MGSHETRLQLLAVKTISFINFMNFPPVSFTRALKNLAERQPYPARPHDFFIKRTPLLLLTVSFYLIALGIRSWDNLLHPGLYMEDATHYFNIYYGGSRYFSFILQHPNGYYNILNNVVAWAASMLDVRLQPLTYHIFSLSMGMLTACSMLFSGLINNRSIILITPIVLGLSGMNHIYYYTSLTFQMYNVVVVLLCFLLYPPTTTIPGLIILLTTSTLLIWSGPYSVVAVPVSLLLLLMFKNGIKSRFLVWVILCALTYSASVGESMIRLQNLLDPYICKILVTTLFERVFFLDLLGTISFLKLFFFCSLLLVIFFSLRKDTQYLKISLVLFAIITGSMAPLFLSIKFVLYQTVFPCHIYISQFFWLFFILYTLDKLITLWSTVPVINLIIPLILVLIVWVDNVRHPAKRYKKIMTNIPPFLETIHNAEQLQLAEKNEYVVVKTDNVIPGALNPMVRVGSLQPDAKRLKRKDITISSGYIFIVN